MPHGAREFFRAGDDVMKRWSGLLLAALWMFFASAPIAAAAESTDAAAAQSETDAQAVREAKIAAMAAARAAQRAEAAAGHAEKKAARAEKQAKDEKKPRYQTLFTSDGFTYELDVKNTRWVLRPYHSEEYMIDAWVRLVENPDGRPLAEDKKLRVAKYFLEHYYISPTRREIMFISELEVKGRPDNGVKERGYDPTRWEKLIPGSIEDDLYEAITAQMKSPPGRQKGILSGVNGMSLRDAIEEFLRISL